MKESRIIRGVAVWDRKAQSLIAIDLDVSFDIDAIAGELAQKAYDNKARKSYVQGGLLEVKRRGTRADPVRSAAFVP